MRRRSKAAGCFLMVGIAAAGQQANLPKWPRVRVNVSIMDKSDAPAAGVKADALEVTDGSPVSDAVLRPVGDAPESVCLLVDTSGSTYEAKDAVRAEVAELINKLPASDELCLIDFSSIMYVDARLTMDRSLVSKGMGYLRSSGGSALLDAVVATTMYMQKNAHYDHRVIVLVSDGGENASKNKPGSVWAVLHEPDAPIVYSIANRSAAIAGGWEDQKRLLILTEATGGLDFPVKSGKEAVQTADNLMEAIQGRYELEFTASDPAPDGRVRKLRIALDKDLEKQKMKVVGPDGYVAARQ